MDRSLRLAPEAVDDLQRIHAWCSQPGSGTIARRRVERLLVSLRLLVVMPRLHPRQPLAGTRAFTAEGHRIVYRVHPDTNENETAGDVTILRLFGPGQLRPD